MLSWLNSSTETSSSMKVCLLPDMLVPCEGKYVKFLLNQQNGWEITVCQWVTVILVIIQYSYINMWQVIKESSVGEFVEPTEAWCIKTDKNPVDAEHTTDQIVNIVLGHSVYCKDRIMHETVIFFGRDFHITRQLGYKYTFCPNVVSTKQLFPLLCS
jgi:hypothetical protein